MRSDVIFKRVIVSPRPFGVGNLYDPLGLLRQLPAKMSETTAEDGLYCVSVACRSSGVSPPGESHLEARTPRDARRRVESLSFSPCSPPPRARSGPPLPRPREAFPAPRERRTSRLP